MANQFFTRRNIERRAVCDNICKSEMKKLSDSVDRIEKLSQSYRVEVITLSSNTTKIEKSVDKLVNLIQGTDENNGMSGTLRVVQETLKTYKGMTQVLIISILIGGIKVMFYP